MVKIRSPKRQSRSKIVRVIDVPGAQLEFLSRPKTEGLPMNEVIKKIRDYTR